MALPADNQTSHHNSDDAHSRHEYKAKIQGTSLFKTDTIMTTVSDKIHTR